MLSLTDPEVLELLFDFASLQSEDNVASFFSMDKNRLRYFLYMQPGKNYKTFVIQKKSGKTRTIDAPDSFLKSVQKKLSDTLYEIYFPRKCVKGFTYKESIITNAKAHLRSRFILNIDLSDFFHSINFGRVRGLFLAEPFVFNEQVATLLAQICCFQGRTPQGAPTSPIISNMICYKMDKQLMIFARQHNLIYTRYADDITFSTRTNVFPKEVAFKDEEGALKLSIGLIKILTDNGFVINSEKIRLASRYNRQEVTGLVINKIVNVKRSYVRNLRAMIHSWDVKGYDEASRIFFAKYDDRGKNRLVQERPFKKVVEGKLRFLKDVRGEDDKIYLGLLAKAKKASPDDFKTPLNEIESLENEFMDAKKSLQKGKSITLAERGLLLERILKRLFEIFEVPVKEAFRKNGRGEQIDGAFKFDGKHFLFECKWQTKKIDHNAFDSLNGKVTRASNMSYGMILSINGFSKESIALLKQNPNKLIIAMDGEELERVLRQEYSLSELLSFKIDNFAFTGEPYSIFRK